MPTVNADILDGIFAIDPGTDAAEEVIVDQGVAVVESSVAVAPAAPATALPTKEERQLEEDFDRARSTTAQTIELVRTAMDAAAQLAESGDNPIAYQVLGGMLTAIVQANKELLNLHSSREKVTRERNQRTKPAEAPTAGQVNIEKAVFVGHASDLLRELQQMQKASQPE